ncbi:hypothetical protein FRUB_08097 [Fimbriiglobus ruber]|uniref:Uncharacterized protein n=1 Tax=Fimbriiglobus ruber TaxID=1908690 RepID=A0A225D7B1_9BACT|nr:hypothetical protein FRUB_08097 [Fimbriiglobus ruber]
MENRLWAEGIPPDDDLRPNRTPRYPKLGHECDRGKPFGAARSLSFARE